MLLSPSPYQRSCAGAAGRPRQPRNNNAMPGSGSNQKKLTSSRWARDGAFHVFEGVAPAQILAEALFREEPCTRQSNLDGPSAVLADAQEDTEVPYLVAVRISAGACGRVSSHPSG